MSDLKFPIKFIQILSPKSINKHTLKLKKKKNKIKKKQQQQQQQQSPINHKPTRELF